jgi:segregation and condensation protein B
MEELKAVIEMLLFISDTPLTVDRMRDIVSEAEKKDILQALSELQQEYEERKGGFHLCEVAGGFQFRTRPDMVCWVKKFRGLRPSTLSPAALETLAVIAYRQPVVKADIDRVRGVDAGGVLKGLLDKKLVKMLGRKDVPGKPMMYGTTKRFLEVFNLQDLSGLPTLREMKELQEPQNVLPLFENPSALSELLETPEAPQTPEFSESPEPLKAIEPAPSSGLPELEELPQPQTDQPEK